MTSNYNPNIPEDPNDSLADSQKQFLTNFSKLDEVFSVNHVELNNATSANRGKHTIIELVEQSQGFQTDVGEISVYTKDVEGQTDQLFMRYQGNSYEFQLTNYQIYSIPSTTTQTSYFTFLPGKIIVYFGSYNNSQPEFLKLFPPVAKNIMTASVCVTSSVDNLSSDSVPAWKPFISYTQNPQGFYTEVGLTQPALDFNTVNYNYIIMGNL